MRLCARTSPDGMLTGDPTLLRCDWSCLELLVLGCGCESAEWPSTGFLVTPWRSLGGSVRRGRVGMKGAASTKTGCVMVGWFISTLFKLNTWEAPWPGLLWRSSRVDHCPQCGNMFRTTFPSTINFAGYAIVVFPKFVSSRPYFRGEILVNNKMRPFEIFLRKKILHHELRCREMWRW